MHPLLYLLLLLSIISVSSAQLKVAITIDDVPNTRKFKRDCFKTVLLNKIDSLEVPTTIFINGGELHKTNESEKNLQLLEKWLKNEYITPGNHTYHHPRYSEVGIDSFTVDVEKCEALIKDIAEKHNKSIEYFRFPYNDLGKDTLQQRQAAEYFRKKGQVIAPFTIESSDYVFDYLYEHYLKIGNMEVAAKIAEAYVNHTIILFDFFDSLTVSHYGRRINHIFLCHDNSINADVFEVIIEKLSEKGYEFISFQEALKDEIYQQTNHYYQKWGISWVYRWIADSDERMRLMKSEPDIMEYYKKYQELKKASKE